MAARQSTRPSANAQDLMGRRFGRLVVQALAIGKARPRHWLCRCDCGRETVVAGNNLVRGHSGSCGCSKAEFCSRKVTRHGEARRGRWTPEYTSWKCMRNRCYCQHDLEYARYGGHGISVCDRWNDSFEAFLEDVGRRPSPKHSLDRFPNRDGNYEPGNVRWATNKEQCRNRRSNLLLTFRGETLTLIEWSERLGFVSNTLRTRICVLGWSVDRALSTPVAPQKKK